MRKLKDYGGEEDYTEWVSEVVTTLMIAAAGAAVLISLAKGKDATMKLLRSLK